MEADPDYAEFYARVAALLLLVLPRFVAEGKKVATVAVGCTGGRHRSVHIVESLARTLAESGWRLAVAHRELPKDEPRGKAMPAWTQGDRAQADHVPADHARTEQARTDQAREA